MLIFVRLRLYFLDSIVTSWTEVTGFLTHNMEIIQSTMETTVETRVCTHCSARFDITDADMAFYEKVSPVV